MAGSSSNSSFIVEIKEYPYPSHISKPSLGVKLSDRDNYNVWKTQMIYFLTGHDMLGFINGKFVSPKRKGKAKMEAWKRSDALVVSWILGTLSGEVTTNVVKLLTSKNPNVDFTAKDAWDELELYFTPEIHQQTKGTVSVTDKITNNGNTALHVAVGTSKDPEFFKKMLEKKPEDIQLKDLTNADGHTLLHIAAIVGNTPAAKILVESYPDMLIQKDKEDQTPLALALSNMHTETTECLLSKIETDNIHKDTLFSGTSGDELLVLAISSEEFELAGNLLSHYSKLDSDVVLMAIAQNFPCELSFWERKAVDLARILLRSYNNLDSDVVLMAIAQNYPSELSSWERRGPEFQDTPVSNDIIELPFVKRRVKIRHEASQVLLSVCKFIQLKISSDRHKDYYTNPVLEATRLNALDVVKVLVYHFPDAFWSASEDGHNVIQYAVINRSNKIYNLLYEMSEHKNVYKTSKDSYGNNLLHLAARLAPAKKLNLISGAALQIQYELQWYKEVERFVCPLNITQKNSSQETPQMVFTREHKGLVIEGEKWMKSTAESYTITAALITTIVFAAAITVPGGNNQDIGVPIFTNYPAFTIFAVSDAISLFTAVMSLLMFLSILTARFAEEDFLYKLPRKLIIGLVTLFISTTTMIIAFGAALFTVFGQKNASLLIPIGALTGLTIAFFVALQFPLVVDLMRATYGRRIFGRNTDHIPFNI
ncbi:ankyrin repeat-containing domain, PGG domain protein [Artemisia annua]|uniref:Ankyrin repeat-containing domain, PGG domain protein n=1 Tax=Artemisia annua TaxID=35608 RepID=A0A2U1QCV6_ARTAN|nr:ankyrin repeat-containing domain, PGG domain protein [Artemisia annua]